MSGCASNSSFIPRIESTEQSAGQFGVSYPTTGGRRTASNGDVVVSTANPKLLPILAALGELLALVPLYADRLVGQGDRSGLVRRICRILGDLLALSELGLDFLEGRRRGARSSQRLASRAHPEQ